MKFGQVTKVLFLQIFSQEFIQHFRSDPNCRTDLAIPLSKDITDRDNDHLARELIMEEVEHNKSNWPA